MTPPTSIKTQCAGCRGDLSEDPVNTIKCKSSKCQKLFHNRCISAVKLAPEQTKSWVCPECKAASKKGGDNSLTPVRTNPSSIDSGRTQIPSDNVTLRKKSPQPAASGAHVTNPVPREAEQQQVKNAPPVSGPPTNNQEIKVLTAEIRCLRSEVSSIQLQIAEVLKTFAHYTERLEVISNKVVASEARLQLLEDKQVQTALLQETVCRLQDQLNKQEQAALRNDVEIVGCPETPSENPIHIVLTTAAKIGVTITQTDLDAAWRAGPRVTSAATSAIEGVNHRTHPRPIAVRFTRRATRDKFLKAAKTRRNVTAEDLVQDGNSSQKIYVNERLTRENRQLFRAARQKASDAKFKRCWTTSGSVYVRKYDGASAIHIRGPQDLERVVGSPRDEIEDPDHGVDPENTPGEQAATGDSS